MDMTGAMPREAWVEIYDEDCQLLVRLESQIDGGAIATEYPAFPKGTRGRIRAIRIYADGAATNEEVPVEELPLEELPTRPIVHVSQIG